MKKILFIAPHVSGRGGTETVLRTVVKMLMENNREYVPKIFVLGGSIDKKWLKDLPYEESVFNQNKILRNVVYFFSLLRLLMREKPDLVISLDPMICLLVNKARSLTHGQYSIVSWIHFSLNNSNVRSHLIPNADYHLAISSGIARQLSHLNIPSQQIFTIYNPIDHSSKIINRPKDRAVFIYVGRIIFEGQKRLKDLIAVLADVQGNWKLEVYGDGQDSEICRQYAHEMGISSKVNWNGYVSSPWDKIREATALVLTSAYEGMPMVLAEAISRGVYCISSDCDTGPSDIIKDKINGQLYAPGDLKNLKKILNEIVDGKPLPNQPSMKESLDTFYVENYYQSFSTSIGNIMKMDDKK